MPTLVMPTQGDIDFMHAELLFNGFRQLSDQELDRTRERLGIVIPSIQLLHERVYSFSANKREALVILKTMTDDVPEIQRYSSWVMILEGDRRVFERAKFIRTSRFVPRFMAWARIVKLMVEYWPLCPEDRDFMLLAEKMDADGDKTQKHFFICPKIERHPENRALVMDMEQVLKEHWSRDEEWFYKEYWNKRKHYQKSLENQGRKIGAARESRKVINVLRPENVK